MMQHSHYLYIFIVLTLVQAIVSSSVYWSESYTSKTEEGQNENNEATDETTTSKSGDVNFIQIGPSFLSTNITEFNQSISDIKIQKRSTIDLKNQMRERVEIQIDNFEKQRGKTIQDIIKYADQHEAEIFNTVSTIEAEAKGYADHLKGNFNVLDCSVNGEAYREFINTLYVSIKDLVRCLDNQANETIHLYIEIVDLAETLFSGSYNYTELIDICDDIPTSWYEVLSAVCYRDVLDKLVRDVDKLNLEGIRILMDAVNSFNAVLYNVNACGIEVAGKIDMAGLVYSDKLSACE